MKNCPHCQTSLPAEARFCFACGASQQPALQAATANGFDWNGNLFEQCMLRFWSRLEERVTAEQYSRHFTDYQERVDATGFRDFVHRRLLQLTEEWAAVDLDQDDVQTDCLREAAWLTDDLLDYFFIMHAQDLNTIPLPQVILQYQELPAAELDLQKMALEFLALDQEHVTVYTDFIKMPTRKLRNASKAFLQPEKDEKIWFICDLSFLGTVKEGFAMTENALYWKSGLQGKQKVFYHMLRSLRREREWLLINDLFFNASPSINTKLIWLLRKLNRLSKS